MNQIFKVGEVINPIKNKKNLKISPLYRRIHLKFPSRLNAMALDPSKIAVTKDAVYSPGEIVFSVSIFKDVTVSVRNDQKVVIESNHDRKQLIMHAALIMKEALGIDSGFDIKFNSDDIRHSGLGSSSGMIAAVACAINELYGNPIEKFELIKYLAQNHGEEIDHNKNELQRVQCIGGGAAAGLVDAGMIILSGQSVPIASVKFDDTYKVVIGIPSDFVSPDAKTLMELEIANMEKFIVTGQKYAEKIAYRLVHETMPNMKLNNLHKASKLIYDYRFNYGSIENCAFVYPHSIEIARNLRFLFEDGKVHTLSLSSVGPAFFAITSEANYTEGIFKSNGLNTFVTTINNDGYHVTRTSYENA